MSHSLWKRQVFLRHPHKEFWSIRRPSFGSVYLISCADEIVYIGQSWNCAQRSIESLGRVYHQVSDTSLPWFMAFADCKPEEMHERESAAIRAYAPKFNTSIPSVEKSLGRMPEIIGSVPVFHGQPETPDPFRPENLERLKALADANPTPPWARKRTRRKSAPRPKPAPGPIQPVELTEDEHAELLRHYGVPANGPFQFKVNLCEDGSVITKHGEIIGTWKMDADEFPLFIPAEEGEAAIFSPWVGSLCHKIVDWYEQKYGEDI